MKVFPSDHSLFMNEDSREIPSTVRADHPAGELCPRAFTRVLTHSFRANQGDGFRAGLAPPEDRGP